MDMHCVGDTEGCIERVTDEDLKSLVLDIKGNNVATTSIRCPKQGMKMSLGITLPYLTLLLKNMGAPCSFEVAVLDSKDIKRRFRASTFQVGSVGVLVT